MGIRREREQVRLLEQIQLKLTQAMLDTTTPLKSFFAFQDYALLIRE